MEALERAREYIRQLEARVSTQAAVPRERRSIVVLKVGTSSLVHREHGIRLVRSFERLRDMRH